VHLKALLLSVYIDVLAYGRPGAAPSVGVVSNGRSERLSDPIRVCGLFWKFMPFWHRPSATKDEQIVAVHRSLMEAESHAMYPLDAVASLIGAEPFQATFNYVHMRAGTWDDEGSPLVLRKNSGYDASHYPMGFHVYFDDGVITASIYHDERYYDAAEAKAMLDRYVRALEQLAEGVYTGVE
jgi:hypothetical protein